MLILYHVITISTFSCDYSSSVDWCHVITNIYSSSMVSCDLCFGIVSCDLLTCMVSCDLCSSHLLLFYLCVSASRFCMNDIVYSDSTITMCCVFYSMQILGTVLCERSQDTYKEKAFPFKVILNV